MCGSSSTSKSKGATSSFGGYTFGHGVGSIADQRRAENKAAMGQGTNVSNSPGYKGASQSLGGPKAGEAAVAPVDKPVDKPGVLMQKPRVTSAFGPMGIDGILEKDKGLLGTTYSDPFNEFGSISVPDDIGWDFTNHKPTGGEPTWSPDRGIKGTIRDTFSSVFGNKPDRNMTPEKARTELSQEQGRLGLALENLSEGNAKYENGKLAPDKVGVAMDVGKAALGLFSMNPLSFTDVFTAYDTLDDYHSLFGKRTKTQTVSTPKGQQVAGFGGGTGKGGLVEKGEKDETAMASVQVAAKKKPRRGKSLLNKTGVAGLDDRAPVLMQRLRG